MLKAELLSVCSSAHTEKFHIESRKKHVPNHTIRGGTVGNQDLPGGPTGIKKQMDREFELLETDETFWAALSLEQGDDRTSTLSYTGHAPSISAQSLRTPSRNTQGSNDINDKTRGGRIAKSKTSKGKSPMSHIRTSQAAAQSIREREHRDISAYSTSSPDWAAPNGFSAYEVPFREGLQYVYRAVYMQARETMGITGQSHLEFEELEMDAYRVCLKLIGHMYWLDSTRVSLAVLPASSFQGSRKEQCITSW